LAFSPIKFFSKTIISLFLLSIQAAAYTVQFADEAKTVRLRWKNGVIPVAISTSLTKSNPYIKSENDLSEAIKHSFEAWEKAANVRFEITTTDRQTISASGKTGDGVSLVTIAPTPENLLLFGGNDDVSEETAARTRTFYNNKGFITEADIVLNPYQQFSTDGSIGTFDLQATLTHEIGHLLGLEHSIVSGATMFERQGKNGTYGLNSFSPRTLTADDIAGVRALYGANAAAASADCCGSISGKLSAAVTNRSAPAANVQVWIEEVASGRIVAGVLTSADGVFRLEGIPMGRYTIYARQGSSGESAVGKTVVAAQSLGEIDVIKNRTTNFTKKLKTTVKTFDVRYVGFNGHLSELAVLLNGGKSFVVYVGGKNLDADNYKIRFNSAFLSLVPNTVVKHDYGAEISVISFEVKADQQIPTGEYGFYLQSKTGEIAFSAGGLTVDAFVNPWSGAVFSAFE
jgi:predicted Zn-dependent protease